MKELKLKTIIAVSLMLISCILMLLMSGLSAFAEDTTLPDGWEDAIFEELGYEHAPPSWWDEEQALEMAIEQVKQLQVSGEYVNADWDGEYMYYTLALGTVNKNFEEDSRYSAYFTFYKEEPTFYLESESSNYILCDAYYGIHLLIEDNGSGGMYIYSTTGSKSQPYDYVNSSNKGFRIFEFEEDEETGENIVSYYHMTYGTYHCYSKSNLEPSIWENLGLKAPDVVEDNRLNITVDFTPSLSGPVDRTTIQNGVEVQSDVFLMNVVNRSSVGVQFLMAILPEGDSIDFSDMWTTGGSSGLPNTVNPVYTFMRKNWHYTRSCNLINGYFAWHKISSGGAFTNPFSWSSMNLKANTNYDVVLYAVRNDYQYPSMNLSEMSTNTYGIDFSKCELVYRSTFSLSNPAEYNPSETLWNNVPNDSYTDLDSLADSAYGYVDDSGEVIIGNYDASDGFLNIDSNNSSGSHGGNGSYRIDQSSVNNGFSSLASMCSSYFNLLSSAFGIFPVWLWSIICISIFTIIVVGLIKHLI